MDKIDRQTRSRIMSSVRNKNTKPERIVRSLLHKMGYRFRLHGKELPGTPDIVLPKYGTVIMVHGCFWHGHEGCSRATVPKTNTDFWAEKVAVNKKRDNEAVLALTALSWNVMTIWGCEVKDETTLKKKLETISATTMNKNRSTRKSNDR